MNKPSLSAITDNVSTALQEDIGSKDITGLLIPKKTNVQANIISREPGVICGIDWVNEVFNQIDNTIKINWHVQDGETVSQNKTLCELSGSARHILTGERCALNFLQTLSGTASLAHQYAEKVKDYSVAILDTRKTIPGLRIAQKYAVTCGGCKNHRMGLYDAYLIKENHIAACGSIVEAVEQARTHYPEKSIEVEVENLTELQEALDANVNTIMLDNFSLKTIQEAVIINNQKAKLEISGNVNLDNILEYAATGVDYISIGALTKDCKALDLSLRITKII